ncbi:MAG: UPF0280 family protein [Desulfobulbaceae bacterium]
MKGKTARKKSPESYRERTYRTLERSGLVSTYVRMVETDLHILAPVEVEDEVLRLVAEVRRQIEGYIRKTPSFLDSLVPLPEDPAAPQAVQEMLAAGKAAGVGPMAAVAGTIAEAVGLGLQRAGIEDLLVENGGDIFIARKQACTVAVFAGDSPLSNRVGIRLGVDLQPCGVCCSSGTIGHSLSFGHADAVVVIAPDTALADAAATRIGNEVGRGPDTLDAPLQTARTIKGLTGVLIVRGDQLGAWGSIELVRL